MAFIADLAVPFSAEEGEGEGEEMVLGCGGERGDAEGCSFRYWAKAAFMGSGDVFSSKQYSSEDVSTNSSTSGKGCLGRMYIAERRAGTLSRA